MIIFLENEGAGALTDECVERALTDASSVRGLLEMALADAVFRGVQSLLEGDEAELVVDVAREFQLEYAPLGELFHLRPSEWHMLRNARRLAQQHAVALPMVRVTTCAVCGIGIGIGHHEHSAFIHFPHRRWDGFTRVRVRGIAPICEDCIGRRMQSDVLVASIVDRFVGKAYPGASQGVVSSSGDVAASMRRRLLRDPLLVSAYRSTWRVIDFNRFYIDAPDEALDSVWREYVIRMKTWENRLCALNLFPPSSQTIPSSKPAHRRSCAKPHPASLSA